MGLHYPWFPSVKLNWFPSDLSGRPASHEPYLHSLQSPSSSLYSLTPTIFGPPQTTLENFSETYIPSPLLPYGSNKLSVSTFFRPFHLPSYTSAISASANPTPNRSSTLNSTSTSCLSNLCLVLIKRISSSEKYEISLSIYHLKTSKSLTLTNRRNGSCFHNRHYPKSATQQERCRTITYVNRFQRCRLDLVHPIASAHDQLSGGIPKFRIVLVP